MRTKNSRLEANKGVFSVHATSSQFLSKTCRRREDNKQQNTVKYGAFEKTYHIYRKKTYSQVIQHEEKFFFKIILSSTKGLCLTTERNPLKNKLVLHIIATLINMIYAPGKS